MVSTGFPHLAGPLEPASVQLGGASLGERLGCEAGALQRRDPHPARLAAQANVTCGGCDGGRYSPPRDALEPQNLILNQSVAFWKTSSLRARPLTDDEFAISLGNRTW